MHPENPPTPPPSVILTIIRIACYVASPVIFWWAVIYLVKHIR